MLMCIRCLVDSLIKFSLLVFDTGPQTWLLWVKWKRVHGTTLRSRDLVLTCFGEASNSYRVDRGEGGRTDPEFRFRLHCHSLVSPVAREFKDPRWNREPLLGRRFPTSSWLSRGPWKTVTGFVPFLKVSLDENGPKIFCLLDLRVLPFRVGQVEQGCAGKYLLRCRRPFSLPYEPEAGGVPWYDGTAPPTGGRPEVDGYQGWWLFHRRSFLPSGTSRPLRWKWGFRFLFPPSTETDHEKVRVAPL